MQEEIDYTETTGLSRASVMARKNVRNALRGNWHEDEDFFEKFFPVNAAIFRATSQIKSDLYHKSRWKGIPRNPKAVDSRFYARLSDILNNMLVRFGLLTNEKSPRCFLKTFRCRVLPDLASPIWPGILLAGGGSSFIRSSGYRPTADYTAGISPLEVVLEDADKELARDILATNVQEMFNYQPNRRFAFGLVISQSTLKCYLFDHAGVVFSPSLNYHQQPDQFCAIIAGMASPEAELIGLDTTMFYDEYRQRHIRTRETSTQNETSIVTYLSNAIIFHSSRIIGRGTACFLAYMPDNPGMTYVVKDSWVSKDDPKLEGKESEASLLLHAQRRGVVQGVAQICHSEEICLKGWNGKLAIDSTLNNRPVPPLGTFVGPQRIHTRIVMSTHGKRLQEFSTRKELLLAYYDAVRAHRNLYDIANILHRDIKPDNILIKADGTDGDRGVLIDFDHAIRTDNTSPYSTRRKIGTYLFMSSKVLQGDAPHCYLDDLESFYYVLVYIVTMFSGPNSPKSTVPSILRSWQDSSASTFKEGHFLRERVPFNVEPWFGSPFKNLVARLHSSFGARLMTALMATRARKNPPTADPLTISDEFLSHVRHAIAELEQEENGLHASRSHETAPAQPGVGETVSSTPRKRIRIGAVQTAAASRSLRQNVNYGRSNKF